MKKCLLPLLVSLLYLSVTIAGHAQSGLSLYLVGKGQFYSQTNSTTPVLQTDGPYRFSAFVNDDPSDVTSATIKPPGKSALTLTNDSGQVDVEDRFTTKALLDAAYPSGTYTFNIGTVNEGSNSVSLSLTNDAYPVTIPQLIGVEAASLMDVTKQYAFAWYPLTNGTSKDFVLFELTDQTDSNTLLSSGNPGDTSVNVATNVAAIVPANTLTAGTTYKVKLIFAHATAVNTNAFAKVPGEAVYYKQTSFYFTPQGVAPSCTPQPSGLVSWWPCEDVGASDLIGGNGGLVNNMAAK